MHIFHLSLRVSLAMILAGCAGPSQEEMREKVSVGKSRGVKLTKAAQVLFGSAAYCSQPATVDLAAAQAATPESREIASTGVSPGSARYRLLHSKMHKRVVTACATAARDAGFDLVVRHGDILDARGFPVGDMTSSLVQVLRDGR